MSNTTFVIFGISSDLAKRKLIPAIYNLIKDKKIKKFKIIGLASSIYTVDFLVNNSIPHIHNPDLRILNKIIKNMIYIRGSFKHEDTFTRLKELITETKRSNILYYLSTSPGFFEPITLGLKNKNINKIKKNWVRIVYEKPFGNDLRNAIDLNKTIKSVFSEKQIFRIDHYLGKDLVQNVSVLRFSNEILEPLWNNKHIDNVQIILDEKLGIENRGKSYDLYGNIKDVVQNHMLQLLTLVGMESPEKFDAKHIRDEKYKLLKSVKKIQQKNIVLGQYKGYRKEEYVLPNSNTETFSAIKLFVNNDRWKGVPFYLKAGKKLKDKNILIYIQFKDSSCELFNRCSLNKSSNYLVIQIEPNEGYYMVVNSKNPGSNKISKMKLNFSHGEDFKVNTPEAYEFLLENVIEGDQSAFVRSDEIEESWRIIEDITKLNIKPFIYKPGEIPRPARHLVENNGRKWFR
jgi:glucose-6-phosphate 1-dehydrogenase